MHTTILISLLALGVAGTAHAVCIQDQYGNRYNFVVDTEHNYVYGTVVSGQGCPAAIWPLTGSYVLSQGIQYELTGANPLGEGDLCVTTYKLKGTFPDGAWYYEEGYGAQEFTFSMCGAPVQAEPARGGARR